MRKTLLFLLIGAMILALVACGSEEEPAEEVAAVAPTDTAATDAATSDAPTDTAAPAPTDTVAPTATVPPTAAPTETPEEVAMADMGPCLSCHSDQEQLIQTAAPVEEVPSESSGPG